MKNILRNLIILSAVLLFASCEKQPVGGNDPDNGTNQTLELMISLPEKIEGAAGDAISVKYYSGKGPKTGDVVVLKKSGKEVICNIVSIEPDSFSFEISPEVETGKYSFCIRRGEVTKAVKDVQFNIEIRVEVAEKEGYNIYGIITCDEAGVPGVVVSDGIETAVTDENGIYYLKSEEYNRVVFMSVPSGYETVAEGVVPKIHKVIDGNPATTERVDWTLTKVDNTDHILYVLGDMHLANRTNDLNQFNSFAADINAQIEANKGKRQYAVTLGDMSWDLYSEDFSPLAVTWPFSGKSRTEIPFALDCAIRAMPAQALERCACRKDKFFRFREIMSDMLRSAGKTIITSSIPLPVIPPIAAFPVWRSLLLMAPLPMPYPRRCLLWEKTARSSFITPIPMHLRQF